MLAPCVDRNGWNGRFNSAQGWIGDVLASITEHRDTQHSEGTHYLGAEDFDCWQQCRVDCHFLLPEIEWPFTGCVQSFAGLGAGRLPA